MVVIFNAQMPLVFVHYLVYVAVGKFVCRFEKIPHLLVFNVLVVLFIILNVNFSYKEREVSFLVENSS